MVMCDTCINKWVTTGSQSSGEQLRQEKEVDAQKLKAPQKRTSRRKLESDNSDPKATTFKPDENGCTHGDRSTWKMSTHKCYSNKRWCGDNRLKDPNFVYCA